MPNATAASVPGAIRREAFLGDGFRTGRAAQVRRCRARGAGRGSRELGRFVGRLPGRRGRGLLGLVLLDDVLGARLFVQVMISNRPSWCSAIAVQLSTQSPQLM